MSIFLVGSAQKNTKVYLHRNETFTLDIIGQNLNEYMNIQRGTIHAEHYWKWSELATH